MTNTITDNSFVRVYQFSLGTQTPIATSPVMMGILVSITPAGKNRRYGGQVITMTERRKRCFSEVLGISFDDLNQTLTQLVEADIIRKIKEDVYQVNPYMFGVGDWEDIYGLRMTRRWFDETEMKKMRSGRVLTIR